MERGEGYSDFLVSENFLVLGNENSILDFELFRGELQICCGVDMTADIDKNQISYIYSD
jgi:hypothetical protein